MKTITKPREKLLFCGECRRWTLQELIRAVSQYICETCGHITEQERDT